MQADPFKSKILWSTPVADQVGFITANEGHTVCKIWASQCRGWGGAGLESTPGKICVRSDNFAEELWKLKFTLD